MWTEKQAFGSVAEYERYKAEILGRVRPRSSAAGKIHSRLMREKKKPLPGEQTGERRREKYHDAIIQGRKEKVKWKIG